MASLARTATQRVVATAPCPVRAFSTSAARLAAAKGKPGESDSHLGTRISRDIADDRSQGGRAKEGRAELFKEAAKGGDRWWWGRWGIRCELNCRELTWALNANN